MRIVSNIVNTPLLASDLQDTGGTTVLSFTISLSNKQKVDKFTTTYTRLTTNLNISTSAYHQHL